MALSFTFDTEANQVLFTGNSGLKIVVLNRPEKQNTLNYEMICQIMKNLRLFEDDPSVKLVIIKANGKAFSAGGDVVSVITCSLAGHWTYITMYYKKLLSIQYFIATYRKPLISLINGFVMGAGACLSTNTKFRVVTEKAVFAMPEVSIGLFPDSGASYFLSRLPGYFGEYIGLTCAKLDGAEMVACGLATHFVPSVVLFTGTSDVKIVMLNRPQKLNILNYEMICQIKKNLQLYENNPSVKLVILKANGKTFSIGGDVVSVITCSLAGHWSYTSIFYKKLLTLEYVIATYRKLTVALINGLVMGAGAGLSMNMKFRIVTEKAVFAMPEASIGLFPDVGASYFLSRLPGYFGEYIGLTGATLDGAEMVACGLATHFVPSVKLSILENVLQAVTSSNLSIDAVIETFTEKAEVKEGSSFRRLETINKCFSKGTVEEIIICLEKELDNGAEEWITDALNSMRSASPLSLKIFLKSIRMGRGQNIKQCLYRDYTIGTHIIRRTVSNDFYEGSRAKLLDKDNKPKWEPSKLELVTKEMVDQCFRNVDDEDLECLQLPDRSNSQIIASRL